MGTVLTAAQCTPARDLQIARQKVAVAGGTHIHQLQRGRIVADGRIQSVKFAGFNHQHRHRDLLSGRALHRREI